jgi:hypothetical protein
MVGVEDSVVMGSSCERSHVRRPDARSNIIA